MKMMNVEASVAHAFRKTDSSSLVGARGFNKRLSFWIRRLTTVNLAQLNIASCKLEHVSSLYHQEYLKTLIKNLSLRTEKTEEIF